MDIRSISAACECVKIDNTLTNAEGSSGYVDEHEEKKLHRAVMKAIDEGSISKAAKALVSKGIHPYTPQVMQKLWDLHPQRCLPGVSTTPAFPFMTFSKEDVLKAALSFPKGSSAGPSGLRPAHLREALQCGTSAVEDDLLNSLTEFCNICASGLIPRDVGPASGILCCACEWDLKFRF